MMTQFWSVGFKSGWPVITVVYARECLAGFFLLTHRRHSTVRRDFLRLFPSRIIFRYHRSGPYLYTCRSEAAIPPIDVQILKGELNPGGQSNSS